MVSPDGPDGPDAPDPSAPSPAAPPAPAHAWWKRPIVWLLAGGAAILAAVLAFARRPPTPLVTLPPLPPPPPPAPPDVPVVKIPQVNTTPADGYEVGKVAAPSAPTDNEVDAAIARLNGGAK